MVFSMLKDGIKAIFLNYILYLASFYDDFAISKDKSKIIDDKDMALSS